MLKNTKADAAQDLQYTKYSRINISSLSKNNFFFDVREIKRALNVKEENYPPHN